MPTRPSPRDLKVIWQRMTSLRRSPRPAWRCWPATGVTVLLVRRSPDRSGAKNYDGAAATAATDLGRLASTPILVGWASGVRLSACLRWSPRQRWPHAGRGPWFIGEQGLVHRMNITRRKWNMSAKAQNSGAPSMITGAREANRRDHSTTTSWAERRSAADSGRTT